MIEILVGVIALGFGTGLGLWLSRRTAHSVVTLAASQSKEQVERAQRDAEALREASKRDAESLREASRRDAETLRETSKRDSEALREAGQREANALRDAANREADAARRVAEVDAKEAALRAKVELEEPVRQERAELQNRERRLQQKEENVDHRADDLHSRELELTRRDKLIDDREGRAEELRQKVEAQVKETRVQLERIAGLSADEARRQLVESFAQEARTEAGKLVKTIEDEAREEADRRAKRIIGLAIQRYAGEHVQERAVTVVQLPSDDLKGRLIGREGRNIRALEAATGVDLIIDDTPEAIILSSFDPVRREIARVAVETLVQDGRIHPGRIEEVLDKAREQVEQSIREAGEQAVFELGIHGMHPELVRLVGSLKYRYSFAQNVWRHSIECGYLCGLMAAELGLNIKQARRAGLLHDIGKAVDHEVEGGHAVIGGALARKFGESPKIANAIAAHHEDEKPESVLAHLVAAADALSGARPGARREMLESYVKRLQDLEQIAQSFPGVEKTYAIQAGREIRVMVEQGEVSDEGAVILSREIAKKIEQELTYPGQIKVMVVRETRAVEYAK